MCRLNENPSDGTTNRGPPSVYSCKEITYTRTNVCARASAHTHTHTHSHLHTFPHTHANTRTRTHARTRTHTRTHTYARARKDPVIHVKSSVGYGNTRITQHALEVSKVFGADVAHYTEEGESKLSRSSEVGLRPSHELIEKSVVVAG